MHKDPSGLLCLTEKTDETCFGINLGHFGTNSADFGTNSVHFGINSHRFGTNSKCDNVNTKRKCIIFYKFR